MKYKTLDTTLLKNKRLELTQDIMGDFIVMQIDNKKVNFLFRSQDYQAANRYYEKKIGV